MVAGKVKKPGKRGRKPAKIDLKAKLERSRQSARECRARKKLRYQYLEELVSSKERAICALREELEMVKNSSLPRAVVLTFIYSEEMIDDFSIDRKTKRHWSLLQMFVLCLVTHFSHVCFPPAVQTVVRSNGPGEDPLRD